MTFGQLIEYNENKNFLEKSYTKWGGATITWLFSNNSKFSIFLGQYFKSFIQFVFIVCEVEGYLKILKLSCRPLAFTSESFFKKTRRGLKLVSLSHFLHDFWKKKIFPLLYSINWPNFIVWLPLLREIIGNISIAIVCLTRLWRQ